MISTACALGYAALYVVCFIVVLIILHNVPANKRIKNLTLRRIIYIVLMVLAPLTIAVWLLLWVLKLLWQLIKAAGRKIAQFTGMDSK